MATNTKLHYRGSAVPGAVVSADTTANLPLQNLEIDANFYSLAVAIDTKVNTSDIIPVTNGGTGGTTAATARAGLGLGTASTVAIGYFQVAGSYEAPLTFSNGVSRTTNAITVTYGTSINTVCQGNDSRLSDARTASGGTATNISGTLAIANGGTNITTYTAGDILYASGTNVLSKLAKGTDGQVLKLASGLPAWGTDLTVVPGNAGLTFSIGSAAASGTAVDVSGSGFTADGTVDKTYSVKIGPSMSALATTMTGAGSGFIRKSAADTYSVDTNTYLTASGAVTSFSTGTTGLTPSTPTVGAVTLAGTLAIANGGTNITTYAAGDLLYASATNVLSKLAKGTDGQVLKLNAGLPYWGTDINIAYTASTGLTLTGTAFSVNYGTSGTVACVGNDSRLSDSRVASDVYTWAKAATKPSYTATEVGLGNVANASQVTAVTGTAPVAVTPGTTPVVSMAAATAGNHGYMSLTYATKLDGIAAGATNISNTNQLTNGAGYYKSGDNVSLGTGTFSGDITSTGNITAYYSDDRLKTRTGVIENALDKVDSLDTFYYHANELAVSLGYDPEIKEVGLSAQQVRAIMPEVVAPAPIDPQYLTVRYERLMALAFAAIKELRAEVNTLRGI